MGLLGILLGLALLVWLAYRGWSVLLLAPLAAMVAALFSGQPLLAHWTQTFMGSAAGFVAQFFPMFLLGAVFGKLMDDSGSVTAIADWMTEKLGVKHAVLAVVLAGAAVTYGGVSLFVAFFVIVPMAQKLFRAANIPGRLIPAAVALGATWHAVHPERHSDAVLRHHAVRGAGPRGHCVGRNARLRPVVDRARGQGGGAGRRRLWQRRRC
jgi:H+/gluconate symporter-like permease